MKIKLYGSGNFRTDKINASRDSSPFCVRAQVSMAGNLPDYVTEVSYGDERYGWLKVTEIDDVIEIQAVGNKTTQLRTAEIYVYNISDRTDFAVVSVNQEGLECGIRITDNTPLLLDAYNDPANAKPYVDVCKKIEVSDGSGKAIVKCVKQYTGKSWTDAKDGETYKYTTTYDKGVTFFLLQNADEIANYNAVEDKELDTASKFLVIRSYGRLFVDEGGYYEVVLAHADDTSKQVSLETKFKKPRMGIIVTNQENNANVGNSVQMSSEGDSFTFAIKFTNTPDYGYSVKIDDKGAKWLKVVENPTSIAVSCQRNNKDANRDGSVTISFQDDANVSKTINFTQPKAANAVAFSGFAMSAPASITVEDEDAPVMFTLYAYGEDRNDVEIETVADSFIEIEDVETTEVDGCTRYNCTCCINKESYEQENDIDFYMGDKKVNTMSFVRLSENIPTEHFGWHPALNEDCDKIIIRDDPSTPDINEGDMNMILINASASWCRYKVLEYVDDDNNCYAEITFSESEGNRFSLERKCLLYVRNANDYSQYRKYVVTQGGGTMRQPNKNVTLKEVTG